VRPPQFKDVRAFSGPKGGVMNDGEFEFVFVAVAVATTRSLPPGQPSE